MSVMPFLPIVSLFDLEPFLRPDPRVSPRRRAQAAVKAGRREVVTTSSVVARPRLDRSEHGATVARSGTKGRAVSSRTSLILDWAVINMRKAPHNLVSGRA